MSYIDTIKAKKQEKQDSEDKQAYNDSLNAVSNDIRVLLASLETSGAKKLDKQVVQAISSLGRIVESLNALKVDGDVETKQTLNRIAEILSNLNVTPVVNVPKAQVTVQEREVDFEPLIKAIEALSKKVTPPKNKPVDFSDVTKAVKEVKSAIAGLSFPVSNYVLPFKDSSGKAVQVQVDADGNVPTTTTIVASDLAIGAVELKNATDDTRAVVKSDGTDNALVVTQNTQPLPTGASTSAKQDTGNTSLSSIDGKITAVNTGAVVVSSSALPTGAATAAKQPALGTAGTPSTDVITVQGRASMTPILTDASATTQPVSGTVTANAGTNLNTSALALAATQTDKSQFTKLTDGTDTALITAAGEQNVIATAQPGVDIGDVTINNAAGASAVNIQDGGNSITVDGTFWQATQPVSIATAPVLVAGSAIIGKVGIDQTTPGTTNGVQINAAIPAGSNAIGKLAANSGVDIGDVDVTSTTFPTLSTASTYSPSSFQNLGANATLNVKSSAGNVFSLYCNNENAADRFIQLHNTATTPSAAAVPLYTFRIPAGGDILIGTDFFTNAGANFSTGIAFAFSTTKDTYTAGTAGDQSTIVMYK